MIWTVSKHVDQLIELVCKVNKSAHARPGYVKLQKVGLSSSATGHNPYHRPHNRQAPVAARVTALPGRAD